MGLYLNDYDFLVLPLQKLSKMKKYLKKQKKICSSWTISLRKSILIHQLRFFHFSFSRFNTDTDVKFNISFSSKKKYMLNVSNTNPRKSCTYVQN